MNVTIARIVTNVLSLGLRFSLIQKIHTVYRCLPPRFGKFFICGRTSSWYPHGVSLVLVFNPVSLDPCFARRDEAVRKSNRVAIPLCEDEQIFFGRDHVLLEHILERFEIRLCWNQLCSPLHPHD